MDTRTFNTLELDELKRLLAGHVQSPLGRARALSLLPSTDRDHIEVMLRLTTECVDYFATGGAFGLGEVSDPSEALSQLGIAGTSLDPHEILSLQRIVSVGVDVRGQFSDPEIKLRYPGIAAVAMKIPDLRRMLASIRGKILPTGEVDDNASPELRRVRREINERRARIYRSLESLMRDRAPSAIQDEIVTIRNGRFVIPVRTDSRGMVPGVMHGLSSSGQTSYIEPLGVIEQNNDLVRLREQEEIEIAQVLIAITDTLRANLAGLHDLISSLAEIDFTQAKARLSRDFNCVHPKMNSGRALMLKDARHVLLEQMLRSKGGRIVPISLELDEDHQTMVISGPNAGGKTVALKTVGLAALMAQMGLHVPATDADLPVFEQVLADIGDQQSIAADLSTFTAHMKNIADMASIVRPPALILIDEVGTGTDPDEGAALGVAIIDYFRRAGATAIATTHYNPIKVWASEIEDVLNASVEFDERTLRPTYRLIVGVAGASSGIEIARRMDVPDQITEAAAQRMDPEHAKSSGYIRRLKSLVDEQEMLRAALEEERQATAEKYARLDTVFAEREQNRQREFEAGLADVIREFTAESQRLLGSIKDRAAAARVKKEAETRAAELRRAAAVRLRKQIQDTQNASAAVAGSSQTSQPSVVGAEPQSALLSETAEINERDSVRIKALGKEGVVESISGETYIVLVGSLRFRAKREELEIIKSAPPHASKRAAALGGGVSGDFKLVDDFASEINVIGATVDEAWDRVDKFLDDAFMAGAEAVRIVHGHGKGALRKAVSELLSGHPHVERFSLAPAKEGGAGATVAVLKK